MLSISSPFLINAKLGFGHLYSDETESELTKDDAKYEETETEVHQGRIGTTSAQSSAFPSIPHPIGHAATISHGVRTFIALHTRIALGPALLTSLCPPAYACPGDHYLDLISKRGYLNLPKNVAKGNWSNVSDAVGAKRL